MSASPEGEVEFLGLGLAAAPPVGHLHLELRQGVTALYGENGVGKTRILNAVSDLLAGLSEAVPWGGVWPSDDARRRNRTTAGYERGGLHIRLPLTPATLLHDGWRPAFVRQLARFVEQELGSERTEEDPEEYATELWAELTHAVRVGLPWDSPRHDEAEYLLRHGRWLLVPNAGSELAYLCDPDPRRGLLSDRWLASDRLWRTAFESSAGALEQPSEDQHPRGKIQWLPWQGGGHWEIQLWPLPPQPFLPPTPEVMGLPNWPEWAAIPVIKAESTEVSGVRLVNPPIAQDGDSAVEHTVRRVATLRPRDGTWYPEDAVARISADANAVLRELFLDPPQLSCSVNEIRRWFLGDRPIEWTASVHHQPPIPLDGLGEAHRRFSSFAIQQATSPATEIRRGGQPGQRLSTAVIDEPERALHQLAIEPVARGLAAIADYVVVATHASEVRSFADHRYLVTVDKSGYASVEQPTMTLTSDSLALEARRHGLKPNQLVADADVVLLVEGQHDVEVLRAFMEPEMARHMVLFVALGGTDGLNSIAESAYLFSLSQAPIVICLDNLDGEVGADISHLKVASNNKERYGLLDRMRAQPRYSRHREMKALVALLQEAVKQRRLDRLSVYGFSKRDIVRYVDVDLITSRDGSWEELERQFLSESNQAEIGWRTDDGRRFKDWIGPGYRIPGIRDASARQVARWKADLGIQAHRHPDFGALAALLDDLHPPGKSRTTS